MGPRDFDPVALAGKEADAWAAYYRRQWRSLLSAAICMVRLGFGMSWPRTVRGAWYVLRANQAWAPYPDNDPDAARALMRRFYALVAADGGLRLDPVLAANLEVQWWHVHRVHQRENGQGPDALRGALVELYSYVYRVAPDSVNAAAQHRVAAMTHSDEWVAAGCPSADAQLRLVREELIASYTALLQAVRR